ncbi:hypothetical protein [Nocardia abscessus]|uniref:hypothetical protein n=1 Tax=Nocardia abscessus TaxID=120957 RepID=UPI002458D9E9|nr:hypothetical protein [Nocardia abscessus]
MVQVGDKVLLVAGGVSVFEVLEFEDEDHAVVQAVLDSPGSYPFSVRTDTLVPAEPVTES